MMKIQSLVLNIWNLWFLVFIFSPASSFPIPDFETPDNPSISYTYTRFSDIEKQCGFILSSASDLEPDDNRGDRIKRELFFLNGDWYQEPGGSPLMPFDGRDWPRNSFGYGSPLKLVSFWVMDVDTVRRAKNTVSVSAALEIGITTSYSFPYKPYEWSSKFRMEQGISRLTLLFEGVYIESQSNGGERWMCLLGNATLPTVDQFVDSSETLTEVGYRYNNQPELAQDDQIILVLKYPKTFTLSTRGIIGEMRSLNQKWNVTYFDKVHISSQFGQHSNYQFGSEELVSKACNPYPYRDNLVSDEIKMFNESGLCEILWDLEFNDIFYFVPNWKYVGKKDYHSKLGPFNMNEKVEDFDNFRLMIQDLKCEPGKDQNETKTARVSAVFRVFGSSRNRHREEERTGLSSETLPAEGIWDSSNGQLCMVGCIGGSDNSSEKCNSRICFYIPLTFSMNQRSMVFGTISSVNEKDSYPSLIFEKVTRLKDLSNNFQWNRNLRRSYSYSKIVQASEFQRRSEPSKLQTFFKKSFLWYPSLKGNTTAYLSFFLDVLSSELCAVPPSLPNARSPKTYVNIVVFSLGSFFGRHIPGPFEEKLELGKPVHSSPETTEISGHLSITGLTNISLSFEGLYNRIVGEMYLIGCRDFRTFKKFIVHGANLEGGMDCLVEVKIRYPPRNARWLLNPKIKVSINSQRSKKDPLYFRPISLDTFLISYTKKIDDVIFRKGFEGILRIMLLMVAILCTLGQSLYTKSKGHTTSYISLVMLGLHCLGYCIPLITDDEVLFKWKAYGSLSALTYDFQSFYRFQVFDSIIKILLLIALFVTIKLSQKVWESRSRQSTHAHIQKTRILSDKLVFLISSCIYIIGFFVFRVICIMNTSNVKKLLKWWVELEKYSGLVQDFFLVPQIVGNILWRIQGKTLRKSYYLGFTMVRLVLHIYDYARDPIPNPRNNDYEYKDLGLELYSKLGHILVASIVVLLAMIVYVQQKGDSKKVKPEECEDLGVKSEVYERLLSE